MHSFEWQHTMDARKKIKERVYLKKERRDKDIFDLDEIVLVHGTNQSYILDINGLITTRHRKYLRKIPQKLLDDEEYMNAAESGNVSQAVLADTSLDTDIHEGHVRNIE